MEIPSAKSQGAGLGLRDPPVWVVFSLIVTGQSEKFLSKRYTFFPGSMLTFHRIRMRSDEHTHLHIECGELVIKIIL